MTDLTHTPWIWMPRETLGDIEALLGRLGFPRPALVRKNKGLFFFQSMRQGTMDKWIMDQLLDLPFTLSYIKITWDLQGGGVRSLD